MARILMIGHLPPEMCGQAKIEAANYRTGQFLQPLLEDGHTVCLCAPRLGEPAVPETWRDYLTYTPVAFGKRGWERELQTAADRFNPDCVVAVNFDASLYATRLRANCPVWMDIYGDIITIVQAACYRARSNRGMPTTLAYMREVLRRADKVSVCSTAQRHMAVGELAMTGRLNWESFGYEFTEVVPAGMTPVTVSEEAVMAAKLFRAQHGIQEDDFVVLWCGGYNTWTDVKTLFAGLEAAMQKDPRVYYLSVGANTYQAVDNVYEQFQRLIEQSPHRTRYHLLGWKPWSELQTYYLAANAGLNIDAIHYETLYGTRTRLMEMIAYRLPILTSLGTELSYILKDQGIALVFEIGGWQTMGEQILCLSLDRERGKKIAEQALDYAQREFSFPATTAGLRRWVQSPEFAPDHTPAGRKDRQRQDVSHRLRSLVRLGLWKAFGLDK